MCAFAVDADFGKMTRDELIAQNLRVVEADSTTRHPTPWAKRLPWTAQILPGRLLFAGWFIPTPQRSTKPRWRSSALSRQQDDPIAALRHRDVRLRDHTSRAAGERDNHHITVERPHSSASSMNMMSQPRKAFIRANRMVPRHEEPLRRAARNPKMNSSTTLMFIATVS